MDIETLNSQLEDLKKILFGVSHRKNLKIKVNSVFYDSFVQNKNNSKLWKSYLNTEVKIDDSIPGYFCIIQDFSENG